jgi:hypothetical protein
MKKYKRICVAGVAAAALSVAACGSPTASHLAAAAHPDCQAQLTSWTSGGGDKHQQTLGTTLERVGTDMTTIGTDMQAGNSVSADGTTLAGDLGALEGTVYIIKADMPPKCVPDLDSDYENSLTAVGSAGIYLTELLGSVNKGDTTGEEADMILANGSLSQADSAFSSASTDLNSFNGTGS